MLFVDREQTGKIDKIIENSRFPRINTYLLTALFLMYIVFWIWNCAKFSMFVTSLYAFSRYELLIDLALFAVLIYAAWKVLVLVLLNRDRN